MPDFGPSNDRELDLARQVDRLSIDGQLTEIGAAEILRLLSFRMSSTDSEFFARYVAWRIANPIPK